MKQRKYLRLLSFILAFVMVLKLAPMRVFATESTGETTAESIVTDETAATAQDVCIQGELLELRSENEKHYRQTDGAFTLVQFQVPIHYEDNGEWADIENTLEPVAMFDGTEVYQAVNGDHAQAFASTLETGAIMTISDGDMMISMSLWDGVVNAEADPAAPLESEINEMVSAQIPQTDLEDTSLRNQTLDTELLEKELRESGIPSEIETLYEEGTPLDEGTPSEEEPPSEEEIPSDEEISSEEEIPSAGETPSEEETAESEESETTSVSYAVYNRNAEALILDNDAAMLMSLMGGSEETELTVDAAIEEINQRISSSVLYEDVYPGVDLRYDLHSYNVKESIILNEVQPETESYTYGFLLELDGLTPVLLDDGSISIVDSENVAQYMIPAPYMMDSNEAYSEAVTYALTPQGDAWLLTVQADAEWLEDTERVYPVTIDPTIIPAEADCTFVGCTASESGYDESFWNQLLDDEMVVGYRAADYGQMEMFFKVTQLPVIPAGSIVIDARVGLWMCDYMPQYVTSAKSVLYIHQIKEQFMSSDDWHYGIKWEDRPECSAPMDYIEVHGNLIDSTQFWNITRAAKEWYADPSTNYGLAVTSNQTADTSYRAYFEFEAGAVFRLTYRDTTGIEPYYTYETQSAVRAGTGYVGDYASTLTVTKGDFSHDNVSMPFGFNHVFNSGLSGGELNEYQVELNNTNEIVEPGIFVPDYSAMKTGEGWQLSLQESILRTKIEKSDGTYELYLIYRDGDGTSHYFTYDYEETEYKDEDGLGLNIWLPESATGTNDIYKLYDEQGNKKHFRNGYLVCVEDGNGNKVHLVYNGHTFVSGSENWGLEDSGNRITSIVLENVVSEDEEPNCVTICTFAYEGNYLKSITDYAGRKTTYNYSSGRLTSITHPDGIKTAYTYDSNGNLTKMYDEEAKYGIEYSYSGGGVSGFKEYTINGGTTSYGTQVTRTKDGIQDTVYRYSGNNGTINNSDDILNHYAFDNIGRTINITTLAADQTILGISSGAYAEVNGQDERVNRITKSAQAGQASENLLSCSGLESVSGQTDPSTKWTGGSSSSIVDNGRARTGTGSIKTTLGSTSTGIYSAKYQTVSLVKDKTYNFSCYVNTLDITDFNGGGVYVAFANSSGGKLAACDLVTSKTTTAIENGWHRIYVTYTAPSTGNYRVYVVQKSALGSAYFDDLQLEEVWGSASGTVNSVTLETDSAPASVNLVQNGSFLYGTQEWTMGGNGTDSESGGVHPTFAVITANANAMKRVSQTIPINAPATETFLLSGWGEAASTAECVSELGDPEDNDERYYGLIAKCVYDGGGDDNTEYFYMPFNDDYTGWQHSSCVIVPSAEHQSKTITSITVILAYDNNLNTANFTGISLRKEPCTTYTYDDEGNVIAANSTGTDGTDLEYAAGTSRITKATTVANGTTIYQYEDSNNENLVTDVINDGVGVHITYDVNGNSESTSLGQYVESGDAWVKSETGLSINTSATYSADKTQLESQTNANGYKTSYDYNAARQLLSVAQQFGPTTYTVYKANSDRPDHTYIGGKVSLHYAYTNGLLSSVIRGGYLPDDPVNKQNQTYSMAYDAWGNTTSVSVGSQNLASYDYAASNGPLESMTYGNDDSVEYTYDDLGRVTVEQHLSETGAVTATYQYFYNSEGVLAKKLDIGTGKAVNYEYDSLGRLIHSWETSGSTIEQKTEHLYDTSNRLVTQSWQLGSKLYSVKYSYDADDGSLTGMQGVSGTGSIAYRYDDLKRLASQFNNLFYQNYTYANLGDSVTTNQIKTIDYTQRPNGTQFGTFTLSYGYDNLGNIAQIVNSGDSSDNRAYTYDQQGQMLTEKIGSGTDVDTYTYTYDTYGNIRTKTEPDGTSHTYEYGNANWLDLLTAYDYQTITYDAIGNPTSYYNGTRWAFEWQNGRQLASASKGTTAYTYTYDQDGIRDSKTVDGVVYEFITQNGKVIRQSWNGNTFDVIYDPNGRPFACRYNDVYYVYVLNLQGDVIRVINGSNGATVAEYQYDAWGNILSATGWMASINPIRYRGYYYDLETGFYYLQSRYYDPSIGRFINADSFASTGQGFLGYNMFAYCGNDPVCNADPSGHAWWGTNTVAICDGGSSGFVYNQHNEPYGEMKLESATVSHGGCGPVAVQNAMQLLGNYSTSLEEIIDYYKKSNGFFVNGYLGSSYQPAIDYFEEHGYDTVLLTAEEMSCYSGIEASFDAGIVLYAFDKTDFPYLGVHYVAFRQYDNVGYYYNLYSNSTGSYRYDGYVCDLLIDNGYCPIGMILISGG